MERSYPFGFPEGQPSGESKTSGPHHRHGTGPSPEDGGARDRDLHRLSPLSPLELEIMDLVWDLQECTSAEVIAAYEKVRPLADTTIRTVLTNIRKKGYLDLVPSIERGHRFRPTWSRDAVARQTLKSLVKRLFKGRALEAVTLLLSDDLMTGRDLDELRRIVERRRDRAERGT